MYERISKQVLDEIQQVLARVSREQVKTCLSALQDAHRIVLAGVGREGLATRAFAMRLMHLGLRSHWIWDDTTPAIGPGDLLVATSGSGAIGHIHYIVEQSKLRGAKTMVVTGDPSGPTPQIADVVLWVPATVYKGKAEVVPSIQPMGNLFEQSLFLLFDLLVMELQARLGVSIEEMEARHRNIE